ncbi:MAG TPA: DUF1059 domain-containing protein [Candidatus Deferrimicrobiaceae bacterium]
MGYTLKCRDMGIECDYVVEGRTEEELIYKAAEHGRSAHGIKEISDQDKRKMQRLIREDRAA